MGLDMYAFTVPAALAGDKQFSITPATDGTTSTELAYWRKFNALHGWMEDLYRTKGGDAESFNCVTLRLDPTDLDALETVIKDKELVPRAGFFFGSPDIYPEDIESTQEFITKARAAIADGQVVLYDSWW